MRRLFYDSAQTGEAVELDSGATFVGTAAELRSRRWARTLGYRDAYDLGRPAREVTAEAWTTFGAADRMRRALDADARMGTPGTLRFEQGDGPPWLQRAFCLECVPVEVHPAGDVCLRLTLALLDGAWWRVMSVAMEAAEEAAGEWLGLPCDLPCDLGRPRPVPRVSTGLAVPADVILMVRGPATSPRVSIGGNSYRVDCRVPAGSTLVVDGRERSITVTSARGEASSAFSAGVRTGGEGSGTYVFEPLPPGDLAVSWDGSFALEVGWYEEEGEPPWSLS